MEEEPEIVTSNLVLHLDASQTASYDPTTANATWNDISTPNSTKAGVLKSGASFSSLHGGSIQFDGVDDHVDVPYDPDFGFGTGPFSIALFLRYNNYGGTAIDFRNTGNAEGFSDFFYDNSGGTVGTWSNAKGNYYTSDFRLVIGTWYHVCYVRDGSNFSCYLNGTLDKTVGNADFDSWAQSLRIGASIQMSALSGNIGTLLIYKGKALTQAEVQQNHAVCMPRFLS